MKKAYDSIVVLCCVSWVLCFLVSDFLTWFMTGMAM